MNKLVAAIIAFVVIGGLIFWGFMAWLAQPVTTAVVNKHDELVQKVDERTNYNTKKEVENTCRAMIASYESDRLAFYQYKDSANESEHGWASQAQMRANRTASTYNNYMLKNKAALGVNIPDDIRSELPTIQQEVTP